MGLAAWQYRISRLLGRIITRAAAALTLYRMPPFASTSALVVEGGRILVVIDPLRREPILPGGHLKWREKPSFALSREVQEETGYRVEPRDLVGVFAGEDWTGEGGVVRLIYEAQIVGGSLASSPEGEARWMSLDDLARSESRDAGIVQVWLRGAGPHLD
jgi:ADP-ribose pyrophosphatase YjhB (NUDIX family)